MEAKNEKLINEYFVGESLNLQKIVNDFTSYVLTIIKNMSKGFLTDEDIEEIISDIFFIVWKNKEKLNLNMALKPYIAGISKNVIKNRLRNINLNYFTQLNDEINLYSEIDVENTVEEKEKLEIIYEELQKNNEEKIIFIMFYAQNKKVKNIAKELNLTEFNIYTKLHRIRKKIKKVLEERGYTYGK